MNSTLSKHKTLTAIGLMSGTSLDGIDIALVKTDGMDYLEFGDYYISPLSENIIEEIQKLPNSNENHLLTEHNYTLLNIAALENFFKKFNIDKNEVDLIGFHGQTIIHRPDHCITWQLGNPSLLAYKIGIDVMADFRRFDMAANGHGAPLVPIFHKALVNKLNIKKPVAIVNLGGVGNITYIDRNEIIAFDTGPGNGLLNDIISVSDLTDLYYDHDGQISATGKVDFNIIRKLSDDYYFKQHPPKSLDRYHFNFALKLLEKLTLEDASATLAYFTAYTIKLAAEYLPHKPNEFIICGGGAYNKTIIKHLKDLLKTEIVTFEKYKMDVKAIEAQAFAYIAVRSFYNLPITFPTTTGVHKPLSGGALYKVTKT